MKDMNNEEFERKMALIVERRTQFASDIQQMRELQAQTENVVGRAAHATLEGFRDVIVKIDSLVDSQIRLTERKLTQTKTYEISSQSSIVISLKAARASDLFWYT